jgi:hypothetical protein
LVWYKNYLQYSIAKQKRQALFNEILSQKALRQYKNSPIPTKQDQIVVPTNSVLVLVKAG